jgi:formate dehydrogenase accessory protein FdhD
MHPRDLDLTDREAAQARVTAHEQGCPRADVVPEEVPVALVYNGLSHAVMLASPADLEDFALGFSLSEGLLAHRAELYDLDIVSGEAGISLEMRITAARFADLKQRRRHLAGRSGCGLCGVDSLGQVLRELPALADAARFSPAAIDRALAELSQRQPLKAATGGTHAAAWATADGRLQCVREDVGRHNALDKLIGGLHRQGLEPASGFALISSRASFEMVQKCASVGLPLLVALAAPTGLAVRLAERLGLGLVAFARSGRQVIYARPDRLTHAVP